MFSLDEYVVDVLMRDLIGHDRRPVCFFVYLWLSVEQQRRKNEVEISYRELAWLLRRKLLATVKRTSTATPRYTVLTPWRDETRHSRARGHD
jgi:hypothetical protein